MSNLIVNSFGPIFIGIGATLAFDLWGSFLKQAFKIPSSNFCLVGRWVLYMPKGIFKHSKISSTPQKNAECTVGWIAHYITGILFAIIFLAVAGMDWLWHPTLIPALIFGIITVSASFFIMQPLFGLGFAASKTVNPMQVRLRSLMNHIVFGCGLYIFGLLFNWLI